MADLEETLQLVVDFLRKKSFVVIAKYLEEEVVESKVHQGSLEAEPSSRLEVLIRKGLALERNHLPSIREGDIPKIAADDLDSIPFSPRKKNFLEHASSSNNNSGELNIKISDLGNSNAKSKLGVTIPKSIPSQKKWSPQGISIEGESSFRASSRHSRESHSLVLAQDLSSPRKIPMISASLPTHTLAASQKARKFPHKKKNSPLKSTYDSSDDDDSSKVSHPGEDDLFQMDLTETPSSPLKKKREVGDSSAFENPTNEKLEYFDLRVIYQPNHTGFEESRDFPIKQNDIIAGRYEITQYLGSAAFSRAIQCLDKKTNKMVCIKIIKNTKDFFDQCLDEIKLLKYIKRAGDPDANYVLRMFDFFYYKEHLFIVCELLGENLYEFYKVNKSLGTPYFTLPRLQRVAKQCLIATNYIHGLDLIHCDLKPENILMHDAADCRIKVIDFGSSCFIGDELSTYVQSRSYRAPEVILGLAYGQKIDMWSIGCILAELFTGNVLFQNTSVATLLGRIISILGPFDQKILQKGKFTNKYFTSDGILYEKTREGLSQVLFPQTTLKTQIGTADDQFIDFLDCLLRLNPKERYSATDALGHPWLSVQYPDSQWSAW